MPSLTSWRKIGTLLLLSLALETGVYRKSSAADMYIEAGSHHPETLKGVRWQVNHTVRLRTAFVRSIGEEDGKGESKLVC